MPINEPEFARSAIDMQTTIAKLVPNYNGEGRAITLAAADAQQAGTLTTRAKPRVTKKNDSTTTVIDKLSKFLKYIQEWDGEIPDIKAIGEQPAPEDGFDALCYLAGRFDNTATIIDIVYKLLFTSAIWRAAMTHIPGQPPPNFGCVVQIRSLCSDQGFRHTIFKDTNIVEAMTAFHLSPASVLSFNPRRNSKYNLDVLCNVSTGRVFLFLRLTTREAVRTEPSHVFIEQVELIVATTVAECAQDPKIAVERVWEGLQEIRNCMAAVSQKDLDEKMRLPIKWADNVCEQCRFLLRAFRAN